MLGLLSGAQAATAASWMRVARDSSAWAVAMVRTRIAAAVNVRNMVISLVGVDQSRFRPADTVFWLQTPAKPTPGLVVQAPFLFLEQKNHLRVPEKIWC